MRLIMRATCPSSRAQIFNARLRAVSFHRARARVLARALCARKDHARAPASNSKRVVDSCDSYRRDDIDDRRGAD
jgi:hypothetical protein